MSRLFVPSPLLLFFLLIFALPLILPVPIVYCLLPLFLPYILLQFADIRSKVGHLLFVKNKRTTMPSLWFDKVIPI